MVAAAVVTSACATNGLASLPLPAPGLGSGGYTLTAVFSNALNLPMNAKVKLAGADVGQVESMVARNYTAVTTLRIRDGVLLPQGSTAELRTATPLGDVFVALKPPAEDPPNIPMLKSGDAITLDSTAAAATVESVLSSAAILVNGGAVRNFTNIINGFGKATGDQGQAFGNLIRKSNQLVGTLDTRSDQISGALTQLSRLADQLDYERVRCANSDLICREQGVWLEHRMLLGPRADVDDIGRAFEKVHEQRGALADWCRRAGTKEPRTRT